MELSAMSWADGVRLGSCQTPAKKPERGALATPNNELGNFRNIWPILLSILNMPIVMSNLS